MTIQLNRYWQVTKHSPSRYTANRDETLQYAGDVRFYFCREALEQDLGRMVFPDETPD